MGHYSTKTGKRQNGQQYLMTVLSCTNFGRITKVSGTTAICNVPSTHAGCLGRLHPPPITSNPIEGITQVNYQAHPLCKYFPTSEINSLRFRDKFTDHQFNPVLKIYKIQSQTPILY
ncbi:hypothetical protein CDAR_24201 [Caerostris darwini]|uniref:Uncharacterized protein n=1 Tax=Caerostris darwini TaxID=1538125 RepID=A0AAV4QKX2_9ARAC|nr:hypothetical protein CDAR_24201 [Caerostris darwini]